MKNQSIPQEIQKLYSLQKYGVKLGLEKTKDLLKHLGNPQSKIKAFHVAGSNGKGSTSSYIASILMEAGYKTGLYTSPHFVKFNERIMINGEYIPDDYIIDFVRENESYLFANNITFFEATTALCFKYFSDKRVDFAVVETGLGGRLDATNTLDPFAVIITSISLEHTNVLGNTIEQITKEKAAIIKKGCKVFTGRVDEEAFRVIEDRCNELSCELYKIDDYILERENHIELYTEELNIDKLNSPLIGDYQRINAALALLAVYETLEIVNPHTLIHGIRNVIRNTKIQGRFEIASQNPDLIFDSAHNQEGMNCFIREFVKRKDRYSTSTVLFTALADKAVDKIIAELKGAFDNYAITTLPIERASKLEDLEKGFKSADITPIIVNNPSEYVLEFLKSGKPDECLVVTGSMYLLGEIKSQLELAEKDLKNA